jgi:hypothetical protein
MLRVYLLDPPLPRERLVESLRNRPAWLADRVSIDPSDQARVIVAKWNDRAIPAVERWLKRLGYVERRSDDPVLFDGATGTSWQLWVPRNGGGRVDHEQAEHPADQAPVDEGPRDAS